MFDTIVWIIVIACAFYLFQDRWFKDLDDMTFKKEFKELQENTWKTVDSLKKAPDYGNKEEAIKSYQKRLRDFEKAHISYLRLRERYRHDSKISQIKKDWKSYLGAIGNILHSEWDYDNLWDNKQMDGAHERENKAGIVIEEIEKRFKNYLKD